MSKQITILKELNSNHLSSNTIDEIRDYVLQRNAENNYHLSQFNNVPACTYEIDQHAFDRWNTRVGPIFENIEDLEHTISFLNSFRRIRLYEKKNIGSIDDDIMFTFAKQDGKIIITTFYGRISLVNYLSNFDVLRKFNKKSNDSVCLEQSLDTLTKQSIVVHKKIMMFEGSFNCYLLEIFDNQGQDMIYITVLRGHQVNRTYEINPNTLDLKTRLNGSCLAVLTEIGYSDFVKSYINELRNKHNIFIADPSAEVVTSY